jgi:hypothetical protein
VGTKKPFFVYVTLARIFIHANDMLYDSLALITIITTLLSPLRNYASLLLTLAFALPFRHSVALANLHAESLAPPQQQWQHFSTQGRRT